MNSIERRNEIMQVLKKYGTADVQALAERTHVSKVTIRNDLAFLAAQGMIVRTFGGAVIANQKDMIRLVSNVMNEYQQQKSTIAEEAAKLVCGGMHVFVDTGSTTYQLISYLRNLPITIVTNSLLLASRIKADSLCDLVLIGGVLSKYCMGFVGATALGEIDQIFTDILFLGAAGYSIEDNVLTCENIQESAVKQKMMQHSKKKVLLADSSKNGKKGFAAYGRMSDIDMMITDTMREKDIERMRELGVEVIVTDTVTKE